MMTISFPYNEVHTWKDSIDGSETRVEFTLSGGSGVMTETDIADAIQAKIQEKYGAGANLIVYRKSHAIVDSDI